MNLSEASRQIKDIAEQLIKEHAGLAWEAKQLEELSARIDSRDISGLPPLTREEKEIIDRRIGTMGAIHSYRSRTGASLLQAKLVYDNYRFSK